MDPNKGLPSPLRVGCTLVACLCSVDIHTIRFYDEEVGIVCFDLSRQLLLRDCTAIWPQKQSRRSCSPRQINSLRLGPVGYLRRGVLPDYVFRIVPLLQPTVVPALRKARRRNTRYVLIVFRDLACHILLAQPCHLADELYNQSGSQT